MRITFPKSTINYKKQTGFLPKNPVIFKARCQESSFKLRDVPNLHCPVCGLVMLNKRQKMTFVEDVSSKTGEALVKTLSKYDDETVLVGDDPKNEHKTIYRPTKAKIIEVIKQTALQYPNLNLLQIVRLKKDEFLAPLIKQQLDITFELEKYLENIELPEEERKKIKEIIEDYKSRILGKSENEFKRKDYIHALSNVTQNPLIQEQINEIMEQLPQSNNDVNSFFVKYSKEAKSSRTIASKFVNQSGPSTEHLKPKSKGGKNNTNNYIADCSDCNSERCSLDFNLWLESKPELASNLQKYINQVQDILDKGNFSPIYDNYVEELIKTLNKLSYGKLRLKAPKSISQRQNDTIYQKREYEVEKIKDVMRKLSKRKKEIEEKIVSYGNGSNNINITELEDILKQAGDIETKLSALSRSLSVYQKNKDEARITLDEITMLHIRLARGDESAREKIIRLDDKTNRARYDEAEENILKTTRTIKTLANRLDKLRKKEQEIMSSFAFLESADQLKEISELKVELKVIEDIIKHNEKILGQLRNYKNMSTLEFQDCLDNVLY